jgi:hypothetical protein
MRNASLRSVFAVAPIVASLGLSACQHDRSGTSGDVLPGRVTTAVDRMTGINRLRRIIDRGIRFKPAFRGAEKNAAVRDASPSGLRFKKRGYHA